MNRKTWNVFLPIFGICMITFIIIILFWKRIYRIRQPICPYNNPQLAFVTRAGNQQQPYQIAWPPLSVEQPPPSYYTAINTSRIPPSVSYIKQ